MAGTCVMGFVGLEELLMSEIEELTYEIVRKHLTSGKKIGYDWDSKGSYYRIKAGFFSSIRVGREIVEFNILFRTVPIYGDFDDLWREASAVSEKQSQIEKYKMQYKIIRWLKTMR